MNVGQKIKTRRLELNMSQDELAKKCGYKSRSSINKIEMSRDLPLKKVKLMADALDLSVSYLMDWEKDPQEELLNAYKIRNERNKKIDFAESLSEEEIEIIKQFRSLDDDSKRKFVLMIAYWKENGLL